MQALSRAGLVATSRGAGGGYRLAKEPDVISLDDIVQAIEGRDFAFRCSEVRQRGPIPSSRESCRKPCGVATSFWDAERVWHAALAQTTLGSLLARHAAGDDRARA
jgi:Rrf2 family protein